MTTEDLHSILQPFGVTPPYTSDLITSGLINPTWKIAAGGNDFILQKINTAVFKTPDDIAFNLDQIDRFLKEYQPDYLFVAPIKTVNGKLLQ